MISMAKNLPKLETTCPKCGKERQMKIDSETRVSTNITVLTCPDDDCGHRFAKDQSVKLSGNLVIEIADTMESLGGYSGLGEFVRESIRIRTINQRQIESAQAFGDFLTMIKEDPELWAPILSGEFGDEDE